MPQTKTLRHREVRQPVQGHRAGKCTARIQTPQSRVSQCERPSRTFHLLIAGRGRRPEVCVSAGTAWPPPFPASGPCWTAESMGICSCQHSLFSLQPGLLHRGPGPLLPAGPSCFGSFLPPLPAAHCHPRASSAKTRGFHTQLDEGPETP